METLKRQRTPVRAAFTRMYQQITSELDKPILPQRAQELLRLFSDKGDRLESLDTRIVSALVEDNTIGDEVIEDEYATIESYREKFITIKEKLVWEINKQNGELASTITNSIASNLVDTQKKYRLPELELNKFGGNVREWLAFWGQFKKIHDDKEMAPEDKLQYLSQCMVNGSRPKEIISSYPVNASSYTKAIEALKTRYGNEDILIDVYIRELLKLINVKKRMSDIAQLYDKIDTQLRALETLGVVNNQYAIILFPMVESCLPEELIKAWERQRSLLKLHVQPDKNETDLQLLMNFLRSEVTSEERAKLAKNTFESRGSHDNAHKSGKHNNIATAADLLNSNKNVKQPRKQCLFCDRQHPSHECFKARRMTLEERQATVTAKRACFSCLEVGHSTKSCRAYVKCMLCERKHRSIMCVKFQSNQKTGENTIENRAQENNSSSLANTNVSQNVLLQTIQVKIEGHNGQSRLARAILDTGSQRSYITKQIAREMCYPVTGCETLRHGLFGGQSTLPRKHNEYVVYLANPNSDYRCNFKVLDSPEICEYAHSIPRGAWTAELESKNITLSDYDHKSDKIEILIGADVAGKLFTGNIQQLLSGPVAMETKLGWTLIGKVSDDNARQSNDALLVTSMFVNDCTIPDLWKLDLIGITDRATKIDKEELARDTSNHFVKTLKRAPNGRYSVELPWIESHLPLADNYNIAVKRLQATTKKLKDSGHFDDYDKVFETWKQEGIIEEINPKAIGDEYHYLPHRAVIKEGSSTKIRPVFDASARKNNNTPSLNDCLSKGPNLIEVIPKILMQFRQKKIGVSADIRAAFLQISISEGDRDFLRFLWWKDADHKKIQILRHTRVVFGVASSPFLLAATINHHLDNAPKHLEKTAKQLRNAFYVDNCLTSVDDNEQLNKFVIESTDVLKTAHFELRRWECSGQFTEESRKTMVLGMVWDKSKDSLSCDTEKLIEEFSGPVNKRSLLSTTHKIFDPIGFTCPITVPPKLLLQKTWELKLNWNEPLPTEISEKFSQWREELSLLSEVQIPRRLNLDEGELTLHTFCDASKNAYACVIFLRNETSLCTTINFVQAKNRITPLKDITIPRLELLSCLIGARLTHEVNQTLQIPKENIFFWSDSTTALSWISRHDSWGAFVWNRVSEIRELTEGSAWRHIPGTNNPADLPSRGVGVKRLIASEWWVGPEWLKDDMSAWPSTNELNIDEQQVNSEKRKCIKINLATTKTPGSQIINTRFSNFTTMVKVTAWMKRFIHNCRNPSAKIEGELHVNEVQDAELLIIRLIQQEAFDSDQIKTMKINLEKSESGLLTVKSRLTSRQDTDLFKTPALLPSKHEIVEKIILDMHRNLSHAGVNITLSNLREKYWILRGRKTVSRVISRCVRCRRFTAKPMTSNPPALPADRVNDAAIFEVTGVDLAGPLYLKGGRKVWIVVFTCAVYRAVHLELVSALSTEAFLQALERMISRRGQPRIIYSDNATNFIGANNILNFEADVVAATLTRKIQWKFIPPLSPWWGGWWERMIRIIKNMLRRVLGKAVLKYEEMLTILCNIEAIINSRPLTYMSEDVNDYQALTPALFLNEIKNNQLVEDTEINQKSLSNRYNFKIKLMRDLKERFRKEYLAELMQFTKQKLCKQIKVGDLVFIQNEKNRLHWPLARVIDVFPGRDGFSRVAKLKTEIGEYIRPIQRLHPVEVHEMQEAETLITRSGRRSRKPERLNLSN